MDTFLRNSNNLDLPANAANTAVHMSPNTCIPIPNVTSVTQSATWACSEQYNQRHIYTNVCSERSLLYDYWCVRYTYVLYE